MDRTRLGFVEATQAAFSFLVEDFGFRLVESEPPTFVRYESDAVFLNVYHGRQSYELGVEVGRLSDPAGRRYRLPDVLGAILGRDDKRRTFFQASNTEATRECIQALAGLVAEHYRPVLTGDRWAFDRIAAHTSEAAKIYTDEVVQRPIRDAAEAAWRAQDYTKVRDLYASIRQSLTPVERMRLEYAERDLPPGKE